jgi:hypothetical protein
MTDGCRRRRRRRARPIVWALLLSAGVVAAGAGWPGGAAQARSATVVPYPTADVWPAAIRFLRVDHDYPIKEKDEPAGYVLFELSENRRTYRAALELVKTIDADGRAATQLVCTMPDLPRRYETTMLDKLAAKLRDERGPPAPPPARKPPGGGEPPAKGPASDGKNPKDQKDPKPPGDLSGLPKPPTWGPQDQ